MPQTGLWRPIPSERHLRAVAPGPMLALTPTATLCACATTQCVGASWGAGAASAPGAGGSMGASCALLPDLAAVSTAWEGGGEGAYVCEHLARAWAQEAARGGAPRRRCQSIDIDYTIISYHYAIICRRGVLGSLALARLQEGSAPAKSSIPRACAILGMAAAAWGSPASDLLA